MDWLIWQLADSAFPAGGFPHSGGLEAAWQQGEVRGAADLRRFVRASLWQAGRGALPLVSGAHHDPDRIAILDALCDAFLSNPVANRASRAQGRAFVSTVARVFDAPGVVALDERARAGELAPHLAPAFGASLRALGVPRQSAQRLYLFLAGRGIWSAAVRLGIVGTLEAQRGQRESAGDLEAVLDRCGSLGAEDVAQAAPLIDLFQATHDRLYSRLFHS